ncbi:Ig-like domain-containing protein [Pseudophaeobacter arcticus]|uniref:Ig-like domain-containing protein n=2 Tax=Pseudophaeobacter arcticus TaxID=385492 RepID=UPI0013779E53|nr:Ig-like domain-containing protein [Pseudophaeobacter arcticus]
MFPLVALVLVLALPKPAHAGFSDCPEISTVGHTLALNLTDGECFNADLGLGPNSDGSEDYVIIQMANSAGSTNFQIADNGADARTVSYVVNGVTINSGNPNYTTNCSAGCSASGTHSGAPFSFTYTDTGLSGDTGATVGPPSAFSSPSGGGQSATISTAFASVLTATVVDAGSNPVSGVSVTFTAPGSGASGTFSGGGASETVTTDGSGVATSTTFTANTVAGGYNVVASSAGISNQSFALTNTAGAATTLAVSSGDSQSTAISTSFGTALVALVTDAGGNPVSGVTVNFSAPGSGASASLSAGSAVSDVSGLASVTATANAVAGGYNVTAASIGLTSVTFGLTNLDVVAPTVTLSTSAVSVGPGETFDVTATFSETVTGFALLDVLVNHGSAVALSGSGAVYTITIQPTGSGDVSVSIAAGVAQDISGNGNLASGTISVQNSTVEETSQLIGQFMNTRATQLINNQPDLTGFLSGNGSGQGKGQFNLAVTRGQGTFDISTRPGSRVWTRLQGAISHEGTSDSAYVFGAIGSHFAVNKNLLLGAMLQLDYLDQDDGAASIKGKGWLIGPYFVTKFPDQNLFVEGRLLYGQSSNDVSPFGTYTDKVDTERFLAMLKVSGSMLYGKTTLIPKAQLTYTTDDQKAYRDSLGNLIPDLGVAWGQVELGLDFETPLETRRGNGALLLFGGISAIGSHVKNSGNAVTVSSNLEGGRARAELGLSYQFADQGVFQVETFYDGIGMSGYESYGLQVGLDLKF